jgi:hypothetical protein
MGDNEPLMGYQQLLRVTQGSDDATGRAWVLWEASEAMQNLDSA